VSRTDPRTSNDVAESRQATISGVVVLGLLKALARARVEPAPFCRALGLNVTFLEAPNARVSTGQVTRHLALPEQRARDPWIGLHAGEHDEPRSSLYYMIQSSARAMDCGARNVSAAFSSTRFG
jgi:hypothetical protein